MKQLFEMGSNIWYAFAKYMKKILIGISVVGIFGLLGAWVYLMFFNTDAPPGAEILTDFGSSIGNPGDFGLDEFSGENSETEISLEFEQRVVQLTNREVAGAVLIGNASSTQRVRFMERGTGHTYEVNLKSGRAQRVSGTTIPRVVEAVWSTSGNRVAFRVEVSSIESQWFIGALVRDANGTISLRQEILPADIDNVSFDSVGDRILFTFSNEDGSGGYVRDLKTEEEELLWTLPFSEVTVLWGENTYVYPKPSASWDGYLYSVGENSSLSRIGTGLKGLSADASPTHVLINSGDEGGLSSTVINTDTDEQVAVGIGGMPEKCTFGIQNTFRLWCSTPFSYPSADYPDAWYRGDILLSDFLWEINTENGEAVLLLDFEEEIFRAIDAMSIAVSEDETYVLIQNKYDNTLWLINLTL